MTPYTETREASGELLRIILPLLSRHPAGFTPISYALWYEYAAGTNPALKADLDKMVDAGEKLDDTRAWTLYEKHISRRDDGASMKLRNELERMLHDLTITAATTGDQTNAYSKSLDGFGQTLATGVDTEQLKTAVRAMLEETSQMNARTKALEKQLRESSREVEFLRTELVRAKGEALTDPLTGIANRRGFMNAVELAQVSPDRGLERSCFIAVDIDHFKKCNDTYGHLFGDKVIRNLAQILKRLIKGQDVAGRMGGEEFMIFLPDTPIEGARKLSEQIRVTVESGRITNPANGDEGRITISLGVTDYLPGEALETYMNRADTALYASKNGGRNRVTVAPSGPTGSDSGEIRVNATAMSQTGRFAAVSGANATRH